MDSSDWEAPVLLKDWDWDRDLGDCAENQIQFKFAKSGCLIRLKLALRHLSERAFTAAGTRRQWYKFD